MSRSCHACLVSALLLLTALPVVAEPAGKLSAPSAPSAPAKMLAFDIPPGSLESVLIRFAARARISLVYDQERLQGQRSQGLTGTFAIHDGLSQLLAGTGLVNELRTANDYVLVAAKPPKPASAPVSMPVSVQQARAATGVDDGPVLPPMVVRGTENTQASDGFLADRSSSATRNDAAISEIPQSIQVVTREVMQSQQAQSLEDVLRNVSGVTINRDEINGSSISIRSFIAPMRVNGLVFSGNRISPFITPIAAIERVEVLRGADSIVANGGMEPGGLVDIMLKQPQAETVRELTLEGGSLGHKRAALDLAGALSDDQAWTQRLILSIIGDHRTVDGYDGRRDLYLAPSLGYQAGGTSAVVAVSYQRTWLSAGGSPYVDLEEQGPQGPFVGIKGRADDGELVRSLGFSYDIKQRLWDGWSLQSKGNYTRQQLSRHVYNCIESSNPDDGSSATACLKFAAEWANYGWATENSLHGVFHTGAVKHALVAGMAYNASWQSTIMDNLSGYQFNPFPLPGNLPPIDTSGLTPAYGRATQHFSNLFLQDQLSWGRWHVLANAGYASAWSSSADMAVPPRYGKPTYNFGVSYRLTAGITAYVNRFKSFEAGQLVSNASLDGGPTGTFVTPVSEGQSMEAGLKFTLLDDRLFLTATVFKASLTNVFQDLGNNDAGVDAIVLLPNTRSHGIEFDVTGRVTRGWNIIASYSDTRFSTAQAPEGLTTFSPYPERQASIWSSYDLQSPAWQGWGFGLGLRARSAYTTNIGFTMGGQLCTDASVYYRSKNWSATLGVKNLSDRRLYSDFAVYGNAGVEPGRTVLLTGRYNF
ncbi:MAG: TonB-dependent receptor [Collimonas sp.]|uniref:TonB-dependent siderophore receptor n=1 Tax=Collimonas sp. TaxID=1963772 RepID=UPI0032659B0E